MLIRLSIRDVVLIERLDLSFDDGLCVLTGETGAGKSILLDALGLALGVRAESRLVRHGAARASATAVFNLPPDHPAHAQLRDQGIEVDGEDLILRRVLDSDGRSRAFVNDQPVSVGLLKSLGGALVEVHGQFESQRLLDPANHRGLLDAFGDLGEAVETSAAHGAWRSAVAARGSLETTAETARQDEEFLRHSVNELEALDPQPGEETRLAEQRALMMNGEKLMTALAEANARLSDGDGAEDRLRGALGLVERVAGEAQGKLDEIVGGLERALAEATEASALLARLGGDFDADPAALERDEERLFGLRSLARKHGCAVDGLAALKDEMSERLAVVEDSAHRIEELRRLETQARQAYVAAAARLSEARRRATVKLDAAVARELEELRLGGAKFGTEIEALPENAWAAHGADKVTFMVATNPGAPAGPLNKIASGGELARFTLALKAVLAEADSLPTLVFDEVDAGVGGAVAAAVGERLARLGDIRQVLVVTHSPQVAARGRHHWRVSKQAEDGVRTSVVILDNEQRREEIARMLAGANVTEEARAAATSLLAGGPE